MFVETKLKEKKAPEKPVISVRKPSPARLPPARPAKPAVSPLEEKRKKILEKIKKEREEKAKQRKKIFEAFEKRKKIPVEKEFKKPEYKKIPEKVSVPEVDKLTKLTEQHIIEKKSPEQILKLTGASKSQFDKLKSLIKERIGIKKQVPEELSAAQKKEIKNVFSKLKKLSKKEK